MNDAISFVSGGLEELYLFGDWREVVQTARVRGHLASAATAATAATAAAAAAAATAAAAAVLIMREDMRQLLHGAPLRCTTWNSEIGFKK